MGPRATGAGTGQAAALATRGASTPSMDKVVKYIVWNIAGKVTVVQKNWQLQYQRLSLQGCMVSMIQYNLITIIWDFFSTKLVIIYCGRQ